MTDKEKNIKNKELKRQRDQVRDYRLQCNPDTLFIKKVSSETDSK